VVFKQGVQAQLQGQEVPLAITGVEGAGTSAELPVVARSLPPLNPPAPDDAPPSGMMIDRLMR